MFEHAGAAASHLVVNWFVGGDAPDEGVWVKRKNDVTSRFAALAIF